MVRHSVRLLQGFVVAGVLLRWPPAAVAMHGFLEADQPSSSSHASVTASSSPRSMGLRAVSNVQLHLLVCIAGACPGVHAWALGQYDVLSTDERLVLGWSTQRGMIH
jgi:hypothetical protein